VERKTLFMLLSITIIFATILSACQTEPEVIEKVVTEVVEVETQTEVEVPVDKKVLIYNSYMSDPDPRAADAAAVQMFMDEHPDY
jgi:hypothetical protein